MKIYTDTTENTIRACADAVEDTLKRKPDALLALTAGRSTAALYRELSRRDINFRAARIFAVTEFVGEAAEDRCRTVLENELLSNIGIPPDNVYFPDANDPAAYDALIDSLGGIDLAVLGIGLNAHIGYNEPATPFDSLTHVQKLTDATKRQFIAEGRAPQGYAVTMGIKTICSARDIVLLALGEEKADCVFKAVYARTDSAVPAAFLQLPLNVRLYLDTDAAKKL